MSTRAAANYNCDEVSSDFAGIDLTDGREKGEFISIEPIAAERFMTEVDASGNVAFSEDNDNRHLVKVKLLQASQVHAKLSAILNGDLVLPGGAGIAPLTIIDTNGTSVFVEPEARIQGWPKKAYGQKADKVMEWVFICPDPERFDGGL